MKRAVNVSFILTGIQKAEFLYVSSRFGIDK